MSNKYWNSPALRLKVGRSRLRRALYLALWPVTAATLLLIGQRGYPDVALVLVPMVLLLLWQLESDPAEGVELHWYRSSWRLFQSGVSRQIVPLDRSVLTRWGVCLAFESFPVKQRAYLWIFPDSIETADLHRLRARLVHEHCGGRRGAKRATDRPTHARSRIQKQRQSMFDVRF